MRSRIAFLAAICVGFGLSSSALDLQTERIAHFILDIVNYEIPFNNDEVLVLNLEGLTPEMIPCKVTISGNMNDAKVSIWTKDFHTISAQVQAGKKYRDVKHRQNGATKFISYDYTSGYDDLANEISADNKAGSPSVTIKKIVRGKPFWFDEQITCQGIKPVTRPAI